MHRSASHRSRAPAALATLAVAALTAALAGAVGAQVTEIEFASGPDDTGTIERLLAAFNASHRGDIHVRWRQMARESDAHRRELLDDLAADPGGIDLIASDVIWTAELARDGWVEDLTDRFYDAFDRQAFLAAPLDSAIYRLRIWGVPWYTDAGLLFYRREQLAKSGFSEPPATWAALGDMARKVMRDSDTRWGFVFQGARYEGGTANAAEFIWSAGGELMTPRLAVTGLVVNTVTEVDKVQIGSAAAARGLDIARRLIADGITPAAVTGFREQEALKAFLDGDAVFLRSWPYAYGVLRRAGFTPAQIGVAPLPAAAADGRHASCLGGWNLMLNAASGPAEREAAFTLIRYLTDPAQQRVQALQAGLLPVLDALYDDAALIEEVPLVALGRQVFETQLHTRPMSPFYSEVSASIASAFNRTLQGELTGSEAARLLEDELRAIVIRNR